MKIKRERNGNILDYAIGILMIMILILATFLMPQAYSAFVDGKDLNQVHVVERENFSFKNPVEITVDERVQRMMEALNGREDVRRTLYLNGSEVKDGELLESIREALDIAIKYELIPDISAYEIEKHIIFAEYYNLSDGTQEGQENAFWNIRFSDYETFDFTFRVDASEYIIYQAEVYCAEAAEYTSQLMADDKEVTAFLNGSFMESSESYFEAEGYGALTDAYYGDMVFLLGYERGEYGIYHSPCQNGYLESEGIRWGFIPMTVTLEKSNSINDWGYRGVRGYYRDLFGIEVYEDAMGP